MRINELAEQSGIPAATIKYYVREGLLPGGARAGYNQVSYDESHLHRIRLLRALIGVGGIPVAVVKRVVAAVEDPERTVHSTLGEAQRAVAASSVDEVLATADELGHADLADLLSAYQDTAAQLAELELKWLERADADLDALTERAVIGSVLGDALLAAVRREAQKQASRTHFGTD
ncbi:MerR family transcriptional regulator [Kribbella sp. CA-253562]|uniref:MerR family transcriptional regulator n=1 Tax=Kribbella sp. CA-253562 TaxID=3239942 RepID=UPI003D8A8343